MKKIVSLILSFVIAVSISIFAFAQEKTIHSGYGSYLTISDKGDFCFIENEYYSVFADKYFEEQYSEYRTCYDVWVIEDSGRYDGPEMYKSADGAFKTHRSLVDDVLNNEGVWYLTVIFDYDGGFSREKNRQLAEKLSGNIEVLYCGSTTPCAVVCVNGKTSTISDVVENENVAFVMIAFQKYEDFGVNEAVFEETFTPIAADARKILRYSAGIDNVSENRSEAKKFFLMSDTDYDGKLTASDARTALRISARLEKGHTFWFNSSGCGAWWEY